MNKLVIQVDGSMRGGLTGVGYVVYNGSEILDCGCVQYKKQFTNNQAEYLAAINAIKVAAQFDIDELEIQTDSQLVWGQLTQNWMINKEHLRKLHNKFNEISSKQTFNITVKHIPRRDNKLADKMAKSATKERN